VDGKFTKVFPVHHLFRGVFVPQGKHTVTFTYNKDAFYAGSTITLATLFGVVALLLTGLIAKEHETA